MNDETRLKAIKAAMTGYRSGKISRRRFAGLLGALGISGASLALLRGGDTAATSAPEGGHGGHAGLAAREGGEQATPVLGPRDDGTNLWKVTVGGMDMEHGVDLHAFFPGEITVNAGDAIYFEFAPMGVPGFHTVTFTSGGEVSPLFVPDIVDGTPVASPEGPPRLLVNPDVAIPVGGDVYDGTGLINSGIDVFRSEEGPYTLTFTTPGTYEYSCAIHGIVMKGTVTVQEAGATLPNDLAAYEALAAEQRAALIEEGKAAIAQASQPAATPGANGGTTWEVSAGVGGLSQARVMRFLPAEVRIKVGDTVRWVDGTIGEPHTVTFLGGEEAPQDVMIEPQDGGPPKFVQNYQTFLPAGEPTFDGTGYRNSGFLGLPPEVVSMFGLHGDTYELTFTAAGEYQYYCILHAPGPEASPAEAMTGRVIVTE